MMLLSFVLAILSICLLPGSQSDDPCPDHATDVTECPCPDVGHEYDGGRVEGFENGTEMVSWQECGALCKENHDIGCQGWTFVLGRPFPKCWLHTSFMRNPCPWCISG